MKSAVLQLRCVLSIYNLPIEKCVCPKYGGAKTACSPLHYVKARDQENFVHPHTAVPTTKKGGATMMRNKIMVILTAEPMVAVARDKSKRDRGCCLITSNLQKVMRTPQHRFYCSRPGCTPMKLKSQCKSCTILEFS